MIMGGTDTALRVAWPEGSMAMAACRADAASQGIGNNGLQKADI